MWIETSIYERVSVPVGEDGLMDLKTLQVRYPRLRIEVTQGERTFLLPIICLALVDVPARDDISAQRIGQLRFM